MTQVPHGGTGAAIGGRTPLSRVRRNPTGARYDHETVHAILDEARYCHIGCVVDGRAIVLPTIHDREGDTLFVHGSQSSRMLRAMAGPDGACVTATLFDGLVFARSVFNHTVCYRSAVVFGHPEMIDDPSEKRRALEHLVEHVAPGRSAEARSPNPRELELTTVMRMVIEEASAKVETGPPEDDPDDLSYPVWAGVLPSMPVWGRPQTDAQGAGQFPLPPSVRRLLGQSD